MSLIEEWRWEKSDKNPLQPLWDIIGSYVKMEFERKKKKKREMEKEELIEEVIKRLEMIDNVLYE